MVICHQVVAGRSVPEYEQLLFGAQLHSKLQSLLVVFHV